MDKYIVNMHKFRIFALFYFRKLYIVHKFAHTYLSIFTDTPTHVGEN